MRPYTETRASDEDTFEQRSLLTDQDDLEGGNQVVGKPLRTSSSKPTGRLERLLNRIDQRWSVKKLKRTWGPRLESVVRLMLVATFFDDSLRTVMHFSEHIEQVGKQGCLSILASPVLSNILAVLFLGIGVIAQLLGSLCLLTGRHPDESTKALIGWTVAQPVLYGQLSNVEFVTESISLVGGLLMLRAHLVHDRATNAVGARTQLFGRLLLPAMYLYYAWLFTFWDFSEEETSDFFAYFTSLSKSVVDSLVIVAIVIGSVLLFFGLRSRAVALLLAFVNLGFVTYLHPFFRYIWLEGGDWKYDEVSMPSPHVALSNDISQADLVYDPAQIYDLHRYYFFLGLSTSGALLLLSQYGPGEIAVQKTEVLLPVVRARD